MSVAEQERHALETRAERLALVSTDAAVRRGESDRFEIGGLASSDRVDGRDESVTGGAYAESAHAQLVRAERLETGVAGGMAVHGHSDTTLLGGAMAETYAGPVLVLAGMSDALVAGGGMRVSVADLAVAGLIGFEEKVGTAIADGALVEAYATHFEREYGPGNHVAGFAAFTGTVHTTSATGFRPLFKFASGVRNLTPGGGGGAGPEGPAGGAAPPPPQPPAAPSSGPSRGILGATPDVGDAALQLEDASIYEEIADANIYAEIADYAEIGQGRIALDSSFYDYIGVHRVADDASDAQDTANAADVLANLRAIAEQGGYDDAQRGQILNILNDLDSPRLSDDVDRAGVIAELDRLQLEAGADAVLDAIADTTAPAQFQAEQLDAAQLYAVARAAVDAGEDPSPLLDQLVAVYRWRAENGLEAYPNQADTVENIRLGIDDVLRYNGYEGAFAGAGQGLDDDVLARLNELFNTAEEPAGAADDAAFRADDASAALNDILDDLDDAAASDLGTENAPGRDPRDLTVRELDAYRANEDPDWTSALNPAEPPAPGPADEFRGNVPQWTLRLEDWDDEIVGLVRRQERPALPSEGDRAALLADLQMAEDAARLKVDRAQRARNAVAADVALDQLNVYTLAKEAVQQGEDPLPGLNELVDVYRWRQQSDLATYSDQARIFEDARDEVSLLFRNNGVTSTPRPGTELLGQARALFDPVRELHVLQDASDGRSALAVADADVLADLRADQVADALADQGGGAQNVRWQGRSADAHALADLSTDAAARSALSAPGDVPLRPSGADEAGAPVNLGTDTGEFGWLLDNVFYERIDQSSQTNPLYDEVGGFYSNAGVAGVDGAVETGRAGTGLADYADVDDARRVNRLQLRTQSLPDLRSGDAGSDFLSRADSMPLLPSASPAAAGSAADVQAPPIVLEFFSDDPGRLVGLVPPEGSASAKPIFQLSDNELAALFEGHLGVAVRDATTRMELGRDGFVLVGGGPVRAFEHAYENIGLGLSAFWPGQSGRSLLDLRAIGGAVDISANGHRFVPPHFVDHLRTILPAAGGAAHIREHPHRFLDD